nr:unnamed protein product [Haemonchus contortus]
MLVLRFSCSDTDGHKSLSCRMFPYKLDIFNEERLNFCCDASTCGNLYVMDISIRYALLQVGEFSSYT